jgi:hypothetical protein
LEALARDLHHVGVVQQPIQHRRRQHLVVREGARALRERQVAREHHRATLVALGHNVEEQVGLVRPGRQVVDLVDTNSFGPSTARLKQWAIMATDKMPFTPTTGRSELIAATALL